MRAGRAKGRTAANNADRPLGVRGRPGQEDQAHDYLSDEHRRNFDEILRVLDSCQLTAQHKVATPVNWKQGEDVIIVPAVSNEEAQEKFPGGWKAPKPYLRIVPQPQ